MKVLVVGAAGYVGSILRPALEREHDCTYFDRREISRAEDRMIVGDVNDEAKVRRAVEGIEAIIYAPLGVKPGTQKDVGDIDASFGVNLRAWYRWLVIALEAGIRRFVYASSMSVYHSLDRRRTDETMPADAWSAYGTSKRLAETVCESAAQAHPDITIVALRMYWPRNDQDWPVNDVSFAQGPNDLRRLYLAALACDEPGAHIVQTTGDLDGSRHPHNAVAKLLGWTPEGK